jgi:Flp pilus assembly protein TadG
MRRSVRSLRGQIASARRAAGQVLVLFALFLVVLLVLAGSAYDYASIVVDEALLQDSVDAASLAASNSLASNASLPALTAEAVAQATAIRYLSQNGAATATPGTNVVMTFPTSTPVGTNPPPSVLENFTLAVTRQHPTSFWMLVGINSVTVRGSSAARAARNMLDVMLTLDTTGSLVLSNNLYDYTSSTGGTTVVDAVSAFINQMNPTTVDPRGPKMGSCGVTVGPR